MTYRPAPSIYSRVLEKRWVRHALDWPVYTSTWFPESRNNIVPRRVLAPCDTPFKPHRIEHARRTGLPRDVQKMIQQYGKRWSVR